MGFADKLAAAGVQGGAYGAPPPQVQKPAAYPGQAQYQAYPGTPGQPGQQPQQQPYPGHTAYPPQQPSGGQQYGAPAPTQANPQQVEAYKQMYYTMIRERNLQGFYPPGHPKLDLYANRAPAQVDQLCARWRIPPEIGRDVARLALFDIILFIDDSGSIRFFERIEDLKVILARLLFAVMLFDDDGISVRLMNMEKDPTWNEVTGKPNPNVKMDNIKTEQEVETLVSNIHFSGMTPLGTMLKKRVLEPMVIAKAFHNDLSKPVMIITITDGKPNEKDPNALYGAVSSASSELANTRYGAGAVAFQFAQVGNEKEATDFLDELDKDPKIGHLIDCTSNYEREQQQMANSNPPVDLTPQLWLVKLLMGAIDSSYDRKDEQNSRPSGVSQYGAPQQGQHGVAGVMGNRAMDNLSSRDMASKVINSSHMVRQHRKGTDSNLLSKDTDLLSKGTDNSLLSRDTDSSLLSRATDSNLLSRATDNILRSKDMDNNPNMVDMLNHNLVMEHRRLQIMHAEPMESRGC
ncbi:hypothetical protein G7Y79_00044g079980 [Physcia stellaris]|nr:hypothetical protein G7Y79_00044g079980 [Physcia stellaris]